MSENVISLDEHRPHRVGEVICLNCHNRYYCVAPVEMKYIEYTCFRCDKKGLIIGTGQPIEDKDD